MLLVIASAEVRGPICLPTLSWLIIMSRAPLLSRFQCLAFCLRASSEKYRAALVRELILHLQVEGPFR